MINKVTLIGRVGKAPEVKHFDENSIANFSLATSEKYKNKNGETVEETEWHNVKVFGKLAKIVEKYVTKGQLLFVEGKIKTRSYENKEGNTKFITEIICLSLQMLSGKTESKPSVGNETKNNNVSEGEVVNEADGVSDLPF